jgi:hypothetical protein
LTTFIQIVGTLVIIAFISSLIYAILVGHGEENIGNQHQSDSFHFQEDHTLEYLSPETIAKMMAPTSIETWKQEQLLKRMCLIGPKVLNGIAPTQTYLDTFLNNHLLKIGNHRETT